MENLFDTHFHLDLQKDRAAAIRQIEELRIYTIAVTNLPDLYRKEKTEVASKYIRFAWASILNLFISIRHRFL